MGAKALWIWSSPILSIRSCPNLFIKMEFLVRNWVMMFLLQQVEMLGEEWNVKDEKLKEGVLFRSISDFFSAVN